MANIGIPQTWGDVSGLRILTAEDAARLCAPRPKLSHKGTFGRVVIVAGSMGMAGAAALCAQACMRTGAGLTQIACRESIVPILQTLVPCATCIPLPEQDGKLTAKAAEKLRTALQGADAAAVGCGLGQQEDNLPLLDVLAEAACPVLWDADALNLLAGQNAFARKPVDLLTPHPGEAARLLGWTAAQVTAQPMEALTVLQKRWGGAVLFEGYHHADDRRRALCRESSRLSRAGEGRQRRRACGRSRGAAGSAGTTGIGCTDCTCSSEPICHGRAGQRAEERFGATGATAWEVVQSLAGIWEEKIM